MNGLLLLAVFVMAAIAAITLLWLRRKQSNRRSSATSVDERVWVTAQHINALADEAMAALRDEMLRRLS